MTQQKRLENSLVALANRILNPKMTISLKDEDFAKKLEEVASDSAGKQMLEFAIAMYEKNNSGK